MMCSGIMRNNAQVMESDVSEESKEMALCGMEAITDLEWMVFLQGQVMSTLMDDTQLQQHDGQSDCLFI